jgi:prophage regulatory protein
MQARSTDRFLKLATVLERVTLSKTEIYNRINQGSFPAPVRLGPMRVAFLESEITAWIERTTRERAADPDRAQRRERAVRAAKAAHART